MFYIIFFSQICVSGHKMSLLKWQEMAKSKSALGKKINFVHNAITQKKLGEETSQIGFEKMFKPITSKLDESIASNLRPQGSLRSLPRAQAKKKKAKLEGIDYFPDVDPFEDMDVEGLFDDAPFSPQAKKQISTAAPPTYEEIIQEVGNDDPPEYDEDETPDYSLKPEDEVESDDEYETDDVNEYLTHMNLLSYTTVNITLSSSKMSAIKKKNFLEKSVLPDAIYRRNQLKGYKASFTKKYKRGEITEEQKNLQNERINNSFKVLNDYIRHYKRKAAHMTGSGLGIKRGKKGGSIRFFSNPKELLQKLEVIIGSILAGNTNQGIRNTGVEILDFLLKEGAINKSQHEKLFKNYFKL